MQEKQVINTVEQAGRTAYISGDLEHHRRHWIFHLSDMTSIEENVLLIIFCIELAIERGHWFDS